MWRRLRIVVLLLVLATVAQRAWLQERDRDWQRGLYVALHPVNAAAGDAVAGYIAGLGAQRFVPLEDYFAAQARAHGVTLHRPFEVRLGPQVHAQPPLPPRQATWLQAARWSLQFRWWAWRHSPVMPVAPDIRLYLLYHDADVAAVLSHSTALRKGRVALVNLYGDARHEQRNAVIIAHELLHILGATDKYAAADNLPRFPDGYAEPGRTPLHPQRYAELMGGRIPLSASRAEMPERLGDTLVGPLTAHEIGWVRAE